MTASAAPTLTDRADVRTLLIGGTKLGFVTVGAVVLYLVVSRLLATGIGRELAQALIVLATAPAVSLLPGHWVRARHTEGIAGAAGLALVGTVVFSVFDIVVLRNVHAYPWTWDAIGGGTTWWYLPVWWQLGTLVGWMGAMLTAARSARGETSLVSLSMLPLAGGVVLAVAFRAAGIAAILPVSAGLGYAVTLIALAVVGIARKG